MLAFLMIEGFVAGCFLGTVTGLLIGSAYRRRRKHPLPPLPEPSPQEWLRHPERWTRPQALTTAFLCRLIQHASRLGCRYRLAHHRQGFLLDHGQLSSLSQTRAATITIPPLPQGWSRDDVERCWCAVFEQAYSTGCLELSKQQKGAESA